MSLNMKSLLDIEKYFLLELTYCDNPNYSKRCISENNPIPIIDFIQSVPNCYCSSEIGVKKLFGSSRAYMQDLFKRLNKVYDESDNLKDIKIIGYINDNSNFLGNTKEKFKTGLVAFALKDSEGNGMVIYRGCELNYLSNIILDWSGCVVAALGVVTGQHKRALKFFDENMMSLPKEWNILGHSKGGNLSTYVFINRKYENVNCFVVNAQPYCWFAMTDEQKAWLKSSQYEYVMHSDDPTRAASYVSYVSRVIPLNRYIKQGLLSKHLFFSACFDDYGNLEGGRILRQTTSRVLSKVFNDYSSENRKTKEELLELFYSQMHSIRNSTRFLSIGMDEIMIALNAEAVTLYLKSNEPDEKGEYIYPFLIKGPVNDELYKLKLYRGEGISADCAFNGKIHLVENMNDHTKFMSGIDNATGFTSKSTVSVPLKCDNGNIIGALQVLNKKDSDSFNKVDLDMAIAMSDIIGNFIGNNTITNNYRDFSILSVIKNGKAIFEIERNEYKELFFDNQQEKKVFFCKITGIGIEKDEFLLFNREKFMPDDSDKLNNLNRLEFSKMFEIQRVSKLNVKKIFVKKIKDVNEKEVDKHKIISNIKLQPILKKRISELNDEEYTMFEIELALLNRPMLIIADMQQVILSKQLVQSFSDKLKEIAQNKIAAVIVVY